MKDFKYIFMVGFPRSGTTLAQTLLMCDSEIYSCPETHFFTKGLRFKSLPAWFTNVWTTLYTFMWFKENIGKRVFIYSLTRKGITRKFFKEISLQAELEGKSIVLEKTPGHLIHIDRIEEYLEPIGFIHILRDCDSVIPSIIKASKQWKGVFDRKQNIARWLSNTYLTYAYNNEAPEKHVIVDYAEMLADKLLVAKKLNTILCLNIDYKSEKQLKQNSEKVVLKHESWKSNNLKGERIIVNEKLSEKLIPNSVVIKLIKKIEGK